MASLTTTRMRSVACAFMMAVTTAGLWPWSMAGAGEPARGVEQIGGGGHAAEALLDRLEAADRHVELLADARVGAGGVRDEGGARRRQRRQRDAAPGGERAHQHLPALADLLDAADDVVDAG